MGVSCKYGRHVAQKRMGATRRCKARFALDPNAAPCGKKDARTPQARPPEILIAEAFWRLGIANRHNCGVAAALRKTRVKKSSTVTVAISVCFCPYQ